MDTKHTLTNKSTVDYEHDTPFARGQDRIAGGLMFVPFLNTTPRQKCKFLVGNPTNIEIRELKGAKVSEAVKISRDAQDRQCQVQVSRGSAHTSCEAPVVEVPRYEAQISE